MAASSHVPATAVFPARMKERLAMIIPCHLDGAELRLAGPTLMLTIAKLIELDLWNLCCRTHEGSSSLSFLQNLQEKPSRICLASQDAAKPRLHWFGIGRPPFCSTHLQRR
jgi:hypothetical protein